MQPVVASTGIIAPISWFNNRYIIAMIMKQEVFSITLGDNIQYLRKVNDITQEELAERLSVSRQTISKWEMNQAHWKTAFLGAAYSFNGVQLLLV